VASEDELRELRHGVLRGAEEWRTVGEIVTTSATRAEAVTRLQAALRVSELGAEAILDQQISSWLPENLTFYRNT
jgi:hypothetical protein